MSLRFLMRRGSRDNRSPASGSQENLSRSPVSSRRNSVSKLETTSELKKSKEFKKRNKQKNKTGTAVEIQNEAYDYDLDRNNVEIHDDNHNDDDERSESPQKDETNEIDIVQPFRLSDDEDETGSSDNTQKIKRNQQQQQQNKKTIDYLPPSSTRKTRHPQQQQTHDKESDDEMPAIAVKENRGPITAWSDAIETIDTEKTEKEIEKQGKGSSQSSAYNSGDDEENDMKEMLDSLNDYIKKTERSVSKWKEMSQTTAQRNEAMSQQLEQRRQQFEELLKNYLDDWIDKVTENTSSQVEQINTCIRAAESNLRGMRKIYDKYTQMPDSDAHTDKLKALMIKVRSRQSKLAAPPSSPTKIHIRNSPSHEDQMKHIEAIAKMLGYSESTNDNKQANCSPVPRGVANLPEQFLKVPVLMQTVSCRWKKDKRSCGLTDIAITDNGRLFAVDQHNKAVKIYEFLQPGTPLVQVLGKEVVNKPSRISYLPAQDRIIVTDDDTKSMRIFSVQHGSNLGTLCVPVHLESRLQHPVSHKEMSDGRFAVLDFKTKSIVCWNMKKDSSDNCVLNTEMECPAYLAATADNRIVVTDWKTGAVKLFDVGSDDQPSDSLSITLQQDGPGVSEPHGVCTDNHGLIFVADRRQRAVRIYSQYSSQQQPPLATLDDVKHKVGVPFAVACNSRGMLAVADYTGTVRIYSYLTYDP